jgi:rare lipoprotein A
MKIFHTFLILASIAINSCSITPKTQIQSLSSNKDSMQDIALEEQPLPGNDLPAPLEDMPIDFSSLNNYNWINSLDRKIIASTFFGNISYYSNAFNGRKMASGDRYYAWSHSCANKTLPFGTRLRITVDATQKSIICRVLDRGPFGENRIVDVSSSAAKELGLMPLGVAHAKIEVLP